MKKSILIPLLVNIILAVLLMVSFAVKKSNFRAGSPLFRGFSSEDIREIQISGPVSWVYRKEKKQWFLYKNEVIRIPIKEGTLESILETIAGLSSGKPALNDVQQPEVWGLTDGQSFTVRILESGGDTAAHFRLGLPLHGQKSCFLQRIDGHKAFKVPISLMDMTKESKISDKRFFPSLGSLEDIHRLSIQVQDSSSDLSYTLYKNNNRWVLFGEEDQPVDQNKAQGVVSEIANWLTDGFLVRESPEDYGLENPPVTLILETRQGETWKVSLGNLYGRRAFYAQADELVSDSKSAVYLIPVSLLEKSLLPKAQLLLQK